MCEYIMTDQDESNNHTMSNIHNTNIRTNNYIYVNYYVIVLYHDHHMHIGGTTTDIVLTIW